MMDSITRANCENLRSQDGNLRFEALNHMLAATDQPVDWAYEVWDALVETLRHANNHQRAIAATLLCNLAKSDPEQRMLRDFDAIFAVTKDAKFVTADRLSILCFAERLAARKAFPPRYGGAHAVRLAGLRR